MARKKKLLKYKSKEKEVGEISGSKSHNGNKKEKNYLNNKMHKRISLNWKRAVNKEHNRICTKYIFNLYYKMLLYSKFGLGTS